MFLREHGINVNLDLLEEPKDLTNEKDHNYVSEISWNDLVKTAREEGYTDVKIDDILSHEEIKQAEQEYESIAMAFSDKTKLKKVDIAFLSIAILLQVIRQYFLTPLNKHEETKTAKDAEEIFAKKYKKGGKLNDEYYWASMDCILRYKTVPYDVMVDSIRISSNTESGQVTEAVYREIETYLESRKRTIPIFPKGLSGNTHRYYTLGHDPFLFALFGTSNILTNTMTVYDGRSFHIKYRPNKRGVNVPTVVEKASTSHMLFCAFERLTDCGMIIQKIVEQIKKGNLPTQKEREEIVESFAPVAAFIKAKMHLESDKSTNGLPIPFVQIISPELALELAEYGFDFDGMKLLIQDVSNQAAGSILINAFIKMLHGYICKVENHEELKCIEVRSRKILLISNLIATSSNIVINTISTIVTLCTENPAGADFAYKHMDIGGAIVTLSRVFSDMRFITCVRDEFIKTRMDANMAKIFSELDSLESSLAGT